MVAYLPSLHLYKLNKTIPSLTARPRSPAPTAKPLNPSITFPRHVEGWKALNLLLCAMLGFKFQLSLFLRADFTLCCAYRMLR